MKKWVSLTFLVATLSMSANEISAPLKQERSSLLEKNKTLQYQNTHEAKQKTPKLKKEQTRKKAYPRGTIATH